MRNPKRPRRSPLEAVLAKVPVKIARLGNRAGGLAPFPWPFGRWFWVVTRPDLVRIVTNQPNQLTKGGWIYRLIARALGPDGLFTTADRSLWKILRTLMNPAFAHAAMQDVAQQTTHTTAQRLREWPETVDLFEQFKQLGLEILLKHLFGSHASGDQVRGLVRLANPVFEGMAQRIFLPAWVPGARKYAKAIAAFDRAVYQIIDTRTTEIAERHSAGDTSEPQDLLGKLIASKKLTRSQVHNQVSTAVMAGFDSSAIWLSEACIAVADADYRFAELRAEIAQRIGSRPPTLEDLAHLPLLQEFLQEVLHDNPSFSQYFRFVEADPGFELDGQLVPKGAYIFVSLLGMHSREPFHSKVRLSDAPFGMGARKCIGEDMARVFTALVMVQMLQQFESWERVHPHDNRMVYAMTFRHFNALVRLQPAIQR